jgi:magnesium transporter
MIAIFKTTELGLQTLNEVTDGSWLNVVAPSADEIARLHQELGIPRDFLMYPLDVDERARGEKEDGAVLIVVRIPCFQGEAADIPYTTVPLGIIMAGNVILTVCSLENDVIQEFAAGQVRGLCTGKRSRFILQLFHNTATQYLSYLRVINKAVDALEDRLQRSMRNREVLELLKYEWDFHYKTCRTPFR